MKILNSALGVLLLAFPALAADIDGKWSATRETPRGEMTTTFNLKSDGGTVTGTVANDIMGESEIQDGKIDGDTITFKQVMDRGGRQMTFLYTGKIKGDEIEFTRAIEGGGRRGGGPGAGPGGGGPRGEGGFGGGGRGGPGAGFTAKRVH